MSERMTPIPFKQLMTWIKEEHDNFGTVFGPSTTYSTDEAYVKTVPCSKKSWRPPSAPPQARTPSLHRI